MSDLISRSAVIDIIHKEIERTSTFSEHETQINIEMAVSELPVAYDVEKVVAELEEEKEIAEEHKQKNANLITEFLEFVADNAFQYDTDNGWDWSDLMELAGMFCGKEEHNNGWIPCSERLPEDDRDVLVMMPDGSMMVDFRTASSSGWFWSDNDDMPLAWHELPQPYQPKGE